MAGVGAESVTTLGAASLFLCLIHPAGRSQITIAAITSSSGTHSAARLSPPT